MAAASSSPHAPSTINIPYDNPTLNNKIFEALPRSGTTYDKFVGLAHALCTLDDFSKLQTLPRTLDLFEKVVKQSSSSKTDDAATGGSTLNSVVYFIILINNNRDLTKPRSIETAAPEHYALCFNDFLLDFTPDGIKHRFVSRDITDNVVQGWHNAVDHCLRSLFDRQSYESFSVFADRKKLTDVDMYPMCRQRCILCSDGSRQALNVVRTLDPGVWINSASTLCRSSANSFDCVLGTSEADDESDEDGTAAQKEYNPKNEPLLRKFLPQLTNFLGGESGSGKTTAAIVAGTDCITLYYIPHGTAGDDIEAGSAAQQQLAGRRKFVQWITTILGLTCPTKWNYDGSLPPIVFADDPSAPDPTSIVVPWKSNTHKSKVLLVLDELGDREKVRRNFFRYWQDCFIVWLGKLLCVEDTLQLYFIMIGTGIENFEKPPGSLPSTYQVFTVRAPTLFADLLVATSLPGSQEKTEMKNLSKVLLQLLYTNTKGPYEPHPTCPASYRFLQLVTNPRCAALAISGMRTISTRPLASTATWTKRTARSELPALSVEIGARFGKMHGLAKFEPKDRTELIGAALRCVLTQAAILNETEWKVLANQTGLLADTGFWMRESQFDKCGGKFDRAIHINPMLHSGPDGEEEKYVYVYRSGSPRFRMSKAHVALLLLAQGSICGNDFVVAADWKLFEAATADYLMLCWILKIPTPNVRTFPVYRQKQDETWSDFFHPCFPQVSYGLGAQAASIKSVYRGVLQFALSDLSLNSTDDNRLKLLQRRKKSWIELIKNGNGLIFENGGGASFADVIAVFSNLVIVVQCTYFMKSTLKKDETEKAWDTLLLKNPKSLAWLAECAGANENSGSCQLVVVLAAGSVKSLHSETQTIFVERGKTAPSKLQLEEDTTKEDQNQQEDSAKPPVPELKLPPHFDSAKLRVEVTVAFPVARENQSFDSTHASCLFPVLQYPYDDQSAMETVIGIDDDELMSKYNVT